MTKKLIDMEIVFKPKSSDGYDPWEQIILIDCMDKLLHIIREIESKVLGLTYRCHYTEDNGVVLNLYNGKGDDFIELEIMSDLKVDLCYEKGVGMLHETVLELTNVSIETILSEVQKVYGV